MITAGVGLLISYLTSRQQKAELTAKHQTIIELVTYRLEQVEKKVDIHNNVIERTFKLESVQELNNEKFDRLHSEIESIREGVAG